MFKWRQDKNKVFIKEPMGEIYFEVPDDFELNKTSPALLKLVEYTLFGPHYKDEFSRSIMTMGSRKQGKKIGHSFSAGVDSTAALLLLPPNTTIYYHERSEYLGGQMNQYNALDMMKKMEQVIYNIPSNHEIINKWHGEIRGSFSTDMACCAGLILLADYLDLGYISTGTMLGSTYVRKGWAYQDFAESEYWIRWHSFFKAAGLELMFPVAGASEVITNEIVQKSIYRGMAHSCIRGTAGNDCGACYKCFRKKLLNNEDVIINEEPRNILKKRPLKQGDSMIYAWQRSTKKIPYLEEYANTDVSWSDNFYEKGLELVPEELQEGIKKKLEHFGITMMDDKDIKAMKEYDIR